MRRCIRRAAALAAGVTILLAVRTDRAAASDGVLEINQACALSAAGCVPGDLGGAFPVEIAQAGSYRLTSDLVLPDVNATALRLTGTGAAITIDLGGFQIVGVAQCTPVDCSSKGFGRGIEEFAGGNSSVSVRNGSIVAMGSDAVALLSERAVVEDLIVLANGGSGISVGNLARVRRVTVDANGDYGIRIGDDGSVADSIVSRNRGFGIATAAAAELSGNVASDNLFEGIAGGSGNTVRGNSVRRNRIGILAGEGSTLIENSSTENDDDGIFAFAGSTLIGNSARENGTGSVSDDGIECNGGGCTIRENSASENSGFGLRTGADSAYAHNTITGNVTGPIVGTGVNAGGNHCAGPGTVSATCP
jgi:hypothetical protein